MKQLKGSLVLVMVISSLLSIGLVQLVGCAGGPNRVAYEGSATGRVTTQEGLKLWNQFVKAGKTTIAQETAVRSAYQKVQKSAFVLCDAGKALSAASNATDQNTVSVLLTAFEQATSDFSQDKADFLTMLQSFGIQLSPK